MHTRLTVTVVIPAERARKFCYIVGNLLSKRLRPPLAARLYAALSPTEIACTPRKHASRRLDRTSSDAPRQRR